MDLSSLKEFLVLAETNSFFEAAERLYMNQSTLSKHLKALEGELGVPLFERSTRHVHLTAFGEQLLPTARQITELYSRYELQLEQKKSSSLMIGTIPTMAQYGIIEQILAFKELHPEIRVSIVEGDSLELRQSLLQNRLELAFLRDGEAPFSTPGPEDHLLRREVLQTDRLVAVIPAGHPLSGAQTLTLPQLKDQRLCLLKESSLLYGICLRACQTAGFTPRVFFESHRIANLLDMCVRGSCVALLLDRQLDEPSARQGIREGLFQLAALEPAITTSVSLCRRKGDLSSAARSFLAFFREREAASGPV